MSAPAPVACGPATTIPPILSRAAPAPAGALPIVTSGITPWTGVNAPVVQGASPTLAADEFGQAQPRPTTGFGPSSTAGGWEISGTFGITFEFNVRSGTGPAGQRDITGANDPAVNRSNFVAIADDLWPYRSNCNGRPTRAKFWSEALTIKHERFHVSEQIDAVRKATKAVNDYLLTETTDGTPTDFQNLLPAISSRWQNSYETDMVQPAAEERAYADGAPEYRKLALEVFDRF